MGLDQYAYAVMPNKENTDLSIAGATTEIAYWRKHPNLQGWMEALYVNKGGTDTFNCTPVRLTDEDLDALESAVMGDDLPETTGFFFGESWPEDKKDDLAFIDKAREAMAQDMEIYYDSWW